MKKPRKIQYPAGVVCLEWLRENRVFHRVCPYENGGGTWFSWSGPLAAGSDVSWAIQGPSAIIEYANDARGGTGGGNPADHVHTIYRDLAREYGGGLLDRPQR